MSKCLLVVPLERLGRLFCLECRREVMAVETNLVITNNNIWKNRKEQAIDTIGSLMTEDQWPLPRQHNRDQEVIQ